MISIIFSKQAIEKFIYRVVMLFANHIIMIFVKMNFVDTEFRRKNLKIN